MGEVREGSATQFLRNRYWILRHGKSIPNERGLIVSSLENGVLTEFELAPEGVNQVQAAGEQFLKEMDNLVHTMGSFKDGIYADFTYFHFVECQNVTYPELEANNILLKDAQICYSPFSRTVHTAKVVANVLDIPFDGLQCKMIPELRERFFGKAFELHSHDKYADIWALDEGDPFKPPEGGESVADVVSRLAIALTIIETEFEGRAILLVSHGDPLQIIQTVVHAVKEQMGSCGIGRDILSKIKEVTTMEILSQHRRSAMLTGELRRLI